MVKRGSSLVSLIALLVACSPASGAEAHTPRLTAPIVRKTVAAYERADGDGTSFTINHCRRGRFRARCTITEHGVRSPAAPGEASDFTYRVSLKLHRRRVTIRPSDVYGPSMTLRV